MMNRAVTYSDHTPVPAATTSRLPRWASSRETSGRAAARPSLRRGKISRGDLADMTAQLAIMTRSHVDVATALGSVAAQCRRPALARLIQDVHAAVVDGASFSDALARHEAVLGTTYVATVAAGEASGQMAHVLQQLAQLQRSELRMARTIRSLIAYPVMLASISSLVILALVLFVLPQFAQIFKQYDTSLPLITQAFLAVAAEIRRHWWLWIPLTLALVAGLLFGRKTTVGRRLGDHFLLHAVLFREVSRALIVGRLCRLLGLMIESGVPLLDAIRLTRRAVKNLLFREMFEQLEHEVLNGRGLASTLRSSDIVPPSAAEMIATAERTGTMGEITRILGEHFEEEGEARLRQLVAVAEPVITVAMGCVVAVVVLAVMLPMFDLATLAHK